MEQQTAAPEAGAPSELASQVGVERLFAPESVAVVGASEQGLGHMVFANLLRDFPGHLYPVHPRRPEVLGVKAYPTVDDLPEAVDMAVILVPALQVPDIVERCAARGIGGALVLAAGFAEAGPEGKAAQERMTNLARTSAFPIIGPNCNGFMNGYRTTLATFAIPPTSDRPTPGPIALISQSGGFGAYIMEKAVVGGLQVGWYLSTGNEADMNVARSLAYLIERPEVKVVLSFFEAIRSPEVFLQVVSRAAELGKPIMAVKAGRTSEGARAAVSHTASIAGSSEVYDAVCRQYGLLQAGSVEEMVDFGLAFQTGRRMSGRRVGVLTASGGAGALMADAAEMAGLTVPPLPQPDQDKLAALMPSFASAANPVDHTGAFNPANFEPVLDGLTQSSGVDAVLPLVWVIRDAEADAVKRIYAATEKPMAVAVTIAAPVLAEAGIPTYSDPARAVRALGALARHSAMLRAHERAPVPAPDADRASRVRQLLAKDGPRPFVLESVAKQVLAEYGVPVSRETVVGSAAEAVAAAEQIGGRVALKLLSYRLPHKSDSGALRLGLSGEAAVRGGYEDMVRDISAAFPGIEIEGVLVQEMVPASVEISCGLQRDPVFGPMVAVGLGGTLIEIVGGAVLLRAPFTHRQAREAVDLICDGRLGQASRGLSQAQAEVIAGVLTGVGALALELPEVESVDINPIRVDGAVVRAVDALIVVADSPSAAPDAVAAGAAST